VSHSTNQTWLAMAALSAFSLSPLLTPPVAAERRRGQRTVAEAAPSLAAQSIPSRPVKCKDSSKSIRQTKQQQVDRNVALKSLTQNMNLRKKCLKTK